MRGLAEYESLTDDQLKEKHKIAIDFINSIEESDPKIWNIIKSRLGNKQPT